MSKQDLSIDRKIIEMTIEEGKALLMSTWDQEQIMSYYMKNTISEEECFAPIVELITMEKNDFPPVAIYVHGLASGATGTTFNVLARKLKQYKWITADFGEDIECNVAMLDGMIRSNNPSLIVGTSMGGLTVLYANAPDAVKIVCNPALSIADCVRNTIGLGQHDYFCERQDGKQTFELNEEMCIEWERYIASHKPSLAKKNYAIFSANDELLGDEATRIAQQILSESGYNVYVDSQGVHRITSSTVKIISKIVNEIIL